jgi:hypothetical protein
MKEKQTSKGDKVSRRDFAATSVAAVALPGLMAGEIAAQGMESTPAEKKAPTGKSKKKNCYLILLM